MRKPSYNFFLDIACISYATLIITTTSICQQFYDYVYWRDILTDQFYYSRQNADNAEVQYHKGAQGIKLVLGYIRIFGFTIASTFVFFFALSLAASVYGWFAATPRTTHTISTVGRVLPIVLTSITVGLMHSPPVQESFLVYMFVANTQFVLSLFGSAVLLLMILFKYVNSRRTLTSWNVLYGNPGASLPSSNGGSSKARSIWLGNGSSRGGRSRAYSGAGTNNTYDSWLVIRLSIAFAVLCVFEYTNIIPRIAASNHTIDTAKNLMPDLSVKRARSSIRGYVSGVSPSLVAFLVFGTTKTFQRKMYDTFMPKILSKKNRQKRNLSLSFGDSASSNPPARRPPQMDEFSLADMSPKVPQSGNYSPRFASVGNLSPRLPYESNSTLESSLDTPRAPPPKAHFTPTGQLMSPGLSAPNSRATNAGFNPGLQSKFSLYGWPEARDKALPPTPFE
ncbi:hypothetical protein CORC01_00759 [Colletotrichum orchidophilum]|uniref:Glycoside hydrolase n=1 Tax=Colletotrichum orchidophilum TaxID=1209926 RepID=A0A1G4BRJ4_9PEZI|nr:uncharacterized protein CORC01_00759 [Colletotrichum orchidophilum]OHF03897.1 hypothetical protein CORC01_00759 [Colletotrichum orchidophilum]